MTRLRVIHIISALPVGGVERNLVRLLPRLDRQRFQVSLVCLREAGDLAPEMEAAGIPVAVERMRTRYDPFSLWRLSRRLRAEGAHIVHCHMRRANTSGRLAALLAGVPIRFATERDLGLDKSWRHYLVDRWLGYYSSAVICISKGVWEHEQRHSGLPAAKFRLLYNGLDLENFQRLPPRPAARQALLGSQAETVADLPLVGVVSRLHAIKRIDCIIRAFADQRLASAALAIVGDGEERQGLENLARSLGLTDGDRPRVFFTGFRHDLATVYAALDAAVVASVSEGFGNAHIEALAAGVALVSTPVGIAAEALRPGVDYIMAPTAAAEHLAAAIAAALQPETAAQVRAAGRRAAAAFSSEAQARNLEAIYLEFAAAHGLIMNPNSAI